MNFTKLLPLAGILSAGFVFSTTSVSALTVYDNGTAAFHTGVPSDPDLPDIKADDFSLTGPDTTIRSIHWRGRLTISQSSAYTYEVDNFTLRFYADNSGPSGMPLYEYAVGSAVNRTDTGFSLGSTVYDYSADITPTTLTAGTTYWLSIFNDTTADTDDDWVWIYANNVLTPGNNSRSSGNDGLSWSGPSVTDFSFRLDSEALATVPSGPTGPSGPAVPTVPEPSTLGLVGLGLVGLFGSSRRRKLTTT